MKRVQSNVKNAITTIIYRDGSESIDLIEAKR